MQEFFHAVLPENGLVCIGRLAPAKGSPFLHDVYDNIDAAINGLSSMDSSKHNLYFCVSTLAQPHVIERGKQRVRTQTNAKQTRCIILDMDIKDEDKFYHSKDEAWQGIQNICLQLNLPDPLVVDSGFGWHVYWPMMAGVSSSEWRATTKLLYQALLIVEPKAVADASRVSDSASVLRVPGSLNLKFGKQTDVEIVQWFSSHVDFGELQEKLRRITGSGITNAPLVSLDVVQQEYEKTELTPTLRNCNWTKQYVLNMANTTEPEWYAMMGLASFIEHTNKDGVTINGLDVAHLLSKGHPSYDYDATTQKFYQAKNAQTGPTTCTKLQQINASPCEGCPFRNAVKSPLGAARLSKPATKPTVIEAIVTEEGTKTQEEITIPLPPAPYFRGETGGVYVRNKEKVVNKDGVEEWSETIVKVYDYDLYPIKRYRSELKEEEQLEIHLWLPKDGMIRFRMPTEYLVDYKRTGSYLASRGAITEMGGMPRMAKYLIDTARNMQTVEGAEMEYAKFGWRNVETDNPVFVVGNGIIGTDGELKPAAFPAYLKGTAPSLAAFGDFDKWREAFNVYKDIPNSEPFIMAAMMAFAAPAMALTPYAGALYNMVGKHGAGKSASMKVMSSVWGKPTENHISTKDTVNAMTNIIGYHNSVPVAFDEITHMDPYVASDFALLFTGGRGKNRAGRNGENRENHVSWDTIVVCSSNNSMYDKFNEARKGYNAEAMRLFEVKVQPGNLAYKDRIDTALHTLASNYGLAGRKFIPAVMRNKQALAKAIEIKAAHIMAETKGTTGERFWMNLVAAVYVMGSVAKKMGLHDYDMEALLKWAIGQMHVVRESTGETAVDPIAMLGEFINKNINHMVRVRNGSVDLKTSGNGPITIVGRLEFNSDTLTNVIVSYKALQEWCAASRLDMSYMITGLKDRGVTDGKNQPRRLATGTNLPNVSVRCYVMDMTNIAMEITNEDAGQEESSKEASG